MYALNKNKFLTEKQIDSLLEELKYYRGRMKRDALLLKLLLFTGCRSCEVLQISKSDIDLENHAVFIRAAKKSNDRLIPLPENFFNELVKYFENIDGKLFDMTTRSVRYIWERVRSKLGFLPGVHCLRHSAGVKFYEATRDIKSTKGFLGHKSIANTLIYLDYVESQEKMSLAINKMWKAV